MRLSVKDPTSPSATKPPFYPTDLPTGQRWTVRRDEHGAEHEILPPTATCNGHLNYREGYCPRPAGNFTKHKGTGRCEVHDMSIAHEATRRYHRLTTTAIGALAGEIQSRTDDDPANITDELALARALFIDWVERYQEGLNALLAWNAARESGGKAKKPPKIMNIVQAQTQIRTIAALAMQLEESRLRDVISQGEMVEILREISISTEAALTTCPHCQGSLAPVLEHIKAAWSHIQLWGRRKKASHGR